MELDEIQSVFEKEGISIEISCPKAFELSEKYGITKMELAKYCNIHDIKIRACQLGCFK